MTFIWPILLASLALVPLGVLAARRIDGRRRGRVTALTGARPAGDGVRSTAAGPLDRVPSALVVAALVVLCVALARPQATVAVPRLEGTLMLTFDVSGSMAATDVEPSRMEVAKAAASAIVGSRPPGVVIGVIAFSNAGMAVQAPTDDMAPVTAAIARMTPTEGTSLGGGIVTTVEAIEAAQARTPADYYSSRSPDPAATPVPPAAGPDDATIIVLFSDGEDTSDEDPFEAASFAAERGIRIVTLGVGTAEGATLDLDGFQVQSRLDEGTLRAIAEATGGAYEPAAEEDPAGLVYDELERRLVVRTEGQEVTAIVAAVGLALLLAGAGLSLARAGRLP